MADDVKIDDDNPDAIHQEVTLSPELTAIVGEGPMARGEVTSRLWDYIKTNDLQSDKDGRQIVPDEALGKVVGTGELSMFDMTAKVNEHIG